MKIKVQEKSYREVMALPTPPHRRPARQSALARLLMKAASSKDMKKANFTCRKTGMERLPAGTPCLVLMNHSSFIDLEIAVTLLSAHPFHIICTSDGFVGKSHLMRWLGCIPTRKFQSDVSLVRDMKYTLQTLKSSLLMYPEASYSFDGTATPLPDSLGKFLKYLDVPVVMIKTAGAYLRDPLYNNLRVRNVTVSAEMKYLLSPEDIREKSAEELNRILSEAFTVDAFRWQQENRILIDEPFRAEGLNRVLYKCPHCLCEGEMHGEGETLTCNHCGTIYRLTEFGAMKALNAEAKFSHIPDWYRWQREQVRAEILSGTYRMEEPVDIRVMVDYRSIYHVGTGTLTHTTEGFRLTGCDGTLDYIQKPCFSYSLYSDFYWYEIGDVICIGDERVLYYCVSLNGKDLAAKARLAAEELYKIALPQMRKKVTD